MGNGPITETDSYEIACLAIAWDIVMKAASDNLRSYGSSEAGIRRLTNHVIEVKKAIESGHKIEGQEASDE